MSRAATMNRKTNETDIQLSIELEGEGNANLDLGVPFFRTYA